MKINTCTECGEPCTVVIVDTGIGYYEYGDEVSIHHEYFEVSDCCEAEVEKCVKL